MVGLMLLAGLRDKLHHVTSHNTNDSEDRHDSAQPRSFTGLRKHVPFIASPLDPKTSQWLEQKHSNKNLTLKRRPTVAQQEASRVAGGIFRKQNEASPLELFFDLFFVANLAVFGFNFSQATPEALGNYIGFFSLMWSFWFHVSIHDVRFFVDSVTNRFLKLCQFAIFTSFTGLGPIYNVITAGEETRAFHGLALVFMASRLLFLFQYGVVLWFVIPFKKTILPCALMMLIYLCSAMAFLATYLIGKDHVLSGDEGIRRVNVWYVIIGVEAILVIAVSSVWRILSFKKTHLVERVGLLTLIIMGEGIIGIIRSAANILDGTTVNVWYATGRVIPCVFLIYIIFVLYFTPIAHDRFGTIRQQIWVLLHYPLHVAILLTEEGSAESMLWTTVIEARRTLINKFPSLSDVSHGFSTVAALVENINETMIATSEYYDHLSLPDIYNWLPDLDRISNLTSSYEFASEEFNEHAAEIMGEMLNETSNYFFENFQFEGPEHIADITNASEKLLAYYDSYGVIYTAFYVCSGSLLLCLAIMYWLSKNNKTWEEWLAAAVRAVVGVGLPFIAITAYTQPRETGFMYAEAGWIVAVVVFSYLAVSIIDNAVQNISDRRYGRTPYPDAEAGAGTHDHSHHNPSAHERHYHGAFGPSAIPSPRASNTNITQVTEKTSSPHRGKSLRFQERPRSTGESDSLVSNENTLDGRRGSEQPESPVSRGSHGDEYATQPKYRLPTSRTNSGYGRLDTTEYRTDRSSEDEVMVSPLVERRNGE